MTKNKLQTSENGFAHLGLILIIVVVLGVTGFAAFKVVTSNSQLQDEQSSSLASDDGSDPSDDDSTLNDDTATNTDQDQGAVDDGDI